MVAAQSGPESLLDPHGRRGIAVVAGALTTVGALSLAALRPLAAAPAVPLAGPWQTAAEVSPCYVISDTTVVPPAILLGETVDVTLTIGIHCPVEAVPLHLVLVLDGSAGMGGAKGQEMKQAANQIVSMLKLDESPSTQIGVVEFNNSARTICQLRNDEGDLRTCIQRVGAEGGTRIDQGILEGLRALSSRRHDPGITEVTEAMVLMSDGVNNAGCDPALQAARQAKSQGVLVMAGCVGSDCDEECMRRLASSARYYFVARLVAAMEPTFTGLQYNVLHIQVSRLRAVNILSNTVRYVPDSADPPLADPVTPDGRLTWDLQSLPDGPVTLTFAVEPLLVGYLPINLEATGVFTDTRRRVRTWTFMVPYVTVFDSTSPPTATPTLPPTPTPIPPTPTATPTVMPPSPTPTSPPRIHLPVARRA